MELQSTIASPAAMGVAPIALLMASTSLTGPAMSEVPVSAIASHPCLQIAKFWDPTLILKFVFCRDLSCSLGLQNLFLQI